MSNPVRSTPARAAILAARDAACPAGVVRLSIDGAPAGLVVGFVFATGQVTLDGRSRHADELDALTEAALARSESLEAVLEPYARFVLRTVAPTPRRLTGETANAFFTELGR